ncbi:MAG: hypothetical protein LBD78_12035 [Spirochaetaceae bacterium]|jgi:hypothetical protein|nr:hypothetical protein [Spirochaetaceae bacterium]
MEMTDDLKDSILSATAPLIGSLTAGLLVGLAAKAIESLLVTNYSASTPAGETGVHPTDNGTAISKADVAGTEAEGKLAQDKVAGANGEVKASETEARALTGEATAAESGVSALRTKAGASDIETKALKMT